jgi:hypothetical protein
MWHFRCVMFAWANEEAAAEVALQSRVLMYSKIRPNAKTLPIVSFPSYHRQSTQERAVQYSGLPYVLGTMCECNGGALGAAARFWPRCSTRRERYQPPTVSRYQSHHYMYHRDIQRRALKHSFPKSSSSYAQSHARHHSRRDVTWKVLQPRSRDRTG